jgi:hypothetical protein
MARPGRYTQAVREYNQKWYRDNIDHCKAVQKAREERQPEKEIIKRIKSRAKRCNLEFNLTVDDIIIPSYCPILGIELVRTKIAPGDSSPSLDRIDNTKGYVKGNIRIISNRANRLKGDGTSEEHLKIAKYISNELN